MLKIVNVEIRNFMSFGDEAQKINLQDRSLVLLEGQNLKSSSASSNGAGKTNILEAIVWCLYGKTTKNVSVAEVVNNHSKKNCVVSVFLYDSNTDDHYEIKRYRKHDAEGNGLLFLKPLKEPSEFVENLSGVDNKETQARINNLLGSSFGLFCTSTYFSQANIKPFSLFTDVEIKNTFMESMDLTKFSDALQNARESVKTQNSKIDIMRNKEHEISRDIENSGSRLVEFVKAEANFEIHKKEVVEGLLEKQGALQDKLDQSLKIKTELEKALNAKRMLMRETSAYRELKGAEADIVRDYNDYCNKHTAFVAALNSVIFDSKKMTNEGENVSSKIGTDCSECGKTIAEKDVADVLASLKKKIAAAKEKETSMSVLADKSNAVRDEKHLTLTEIQKRLEDILGKKDELSAAHVKVLKLEGEVKNLKTVKEQIAGLDRQIEENKTSVSYATKLIDEETEKIESLKAQLKRVSAALEILEGDIAYDEYWEHAFSYSGLPSFLIENAQPFVNSKANHYAALSCNGEIRIDFQTITKGKDKFSIAVQHSDGAKSYKGISSGERKRADVCVAQAIQDLSRQYGKNPLDIVFYDEPFEHLDVEGVAGIMEMLRDIAKEVGTVIVVTHNPELKSMFDDSKGITVVKESDGFSKIFA